VHNQYYEAATTLYRKVKHTVNFLCQRVHHTAAILVDNAVVLSTQPNFVGKMSVESELFFESINDTLQHCHEELSGLVRVFEADIKRMQREQSQKTQQQLQQNQTQSQQQQTQEVTESATTITSGRS